MHQIIIEYIRYSYRCIILGNRAEILLVQRFDKLFHVRLLFGIEQFFNIVSGELSCAALDPFEQYIPDRVGQQAGDLAPHLVRRELEERVHGRGGRVEEIAEHEVVIQNPERRFRDDFWHGFPPRVWGVVAAEPDRRSLSKSEDLGRAM